MHVWAYKAPKVKTKGVGRPMALTSLKLSKNFARLDLPRLGVSIPKLPKLRDKKTKQVYEEIELKTNLLTIM